MILVIKFFFVFTPSIFDHFSKLGVCASLKKLIKKLFKFSRTTSSRSSPSCTIDMKICRTFSGGSMKNDGCDSLSGNLDSGSGNLDPGSGNIRIFDESEYVLMTNNNNAQISENIGGFDSNIID